MSVFDDIDNIADSTSPGLKGNTENAQALIEALKELMETQNKAVKTGETLATSLTGITDAQTTLQGVGMTLLTQTKDVAQGFLDTINPLNMLGHAVNLVVSQTRALIKEQDKAITAFNKATGATKLYGSEIVALRNDMFMFGVTTEDAGASFEAMVTTVTDLNRLTPSTRQELAQTTAILGELGVDAQQTAESFQFLTKAMGQSGAEASAFAREAFIVAQNIGMPPKELARAFNNASGDLAAFGAQSTEVFLDLQTNARAAGMEVSEVLSITQKFDTFEGAADSVGRLNAILGGPFLNSMQMVQTTDPTERMRLLSNAISDAGLSFEEMGYYQRIALAEAAGFKDVEELALVMKGGFDEATDSVGSNQSSIEALAAAQAEFVTLGEQLSQMLGFMAVSMRPVIWGLGKILSGINFVLTSLYEFEALGMQVGAYVLPGLAVGLGILIFKFTSLAGILGTVASALAAKAASALAAIPALKGLGVASTGAGTAAGFSATGFLYAGAAIALMGAGALAAGAGVLLVGKGLSLIFESLLGEGLDGILALNQLGASFAMLTVSSLGLALALPTLARFAAIINSLDENKIIPFASLFESVNSILDKDMKNLITMEKSIKDIVGSINSIDDTSKVMEVRKLIQQINSSAASSQAATTGTSATAAANPLSQPLNVKLKMDGREMGTWAYNTVADFLNMGRSN